MKPGVRYAVFIDPSEYRGQSFHFSGDTLRSLIDLAGSGSFILLDTDVSVNETKNLIQKTILQAHQDFDRARNKLAPLKSINDPGLEILRSFPAVDGWVKKLIDQYENHKRLGDYKTLSVASVDPVTVFRAYFDSMPPFHNTKKKERKKGRIPGCFHVSLPYHVGGYP